MSKFNLFFLILAKTSAIVLVCLLQSITAQKIINGQCPTNMAAKTDAKGGAFPSSGVMYHYEGIPDQLTADLKCVWSKFATSSPTDVITYGGVEIANNQAVTRVYRAFLMGPGTYRIDTGSETIEYFLIDTDDKTYVTYYHCSNISATQYKQYIWVLTKERAPSASTISAARAGILSKNLDYSLVQKRDQQGCPAV